VLDDLGRTSIAIVADTADETPVTGGAPVVEQALAALMVDIDVRPMLAFPDTAADLGGAVGVLIDDPQGSLLSSAMLWRGSFAKEEEFSWLLPTRRGAPSERRSNRCWRIPWLGVRPILVEPIQRV